MSITDDAQIVRPFIDAVSNVLSTMAMVKPNAGKPFIKKDSSAHGDITGVIGLSGARAGTISLTFTKECALAVVSSMLGEPITELGDDIRDAVGEMTNMISGQARQGLQKIGLTIEAGIPTVVMGENHSISHLSKNPILAVPFSTDHGGFTLEVGLE
ncbi:chemotaxis protein CheX [Desulfocurvus sp. DL9XJH121]